MRNALLGILIFPLALSAAKDSCVECHSALEGRLAGAGFEEDVHRRRGFSCADCHGGDARSDDPGEAMNPARGFAGKVAKTAVIGVCGRCHSDATLIHRFNPKQRVDQVAQYRTSVHGKRLAAGDTSVATCTDCHGAHGIREVKHSLSPVHPLRVADTCARCHSDAARMARYSLPTDQLEKYHRSVHWEALSKRGDASAPSCASCHGNHGATPPQVASVSAVCGSCHALLEDLFRKSPHAAAFEAIGAGGCVACHDNHEVRKPTTDMLAGEASVCAQCHEPGSKGNTVAAGMASAIARLTGDLRRSDEILEQARRSGMEVSAAALSQSEARESLVKARVAVHSGRLEQVRGAVDEGLRVTARNYRAGEEALHERDLRRLGLAVALVAIMLTIAGLRAAIRAIERPEPGVDSPAPWN